MSRFELPASKVHSGRTTTQPFRFLLYYPALVLALNANLPAQHTLSVSPSSAVVDVEQTLTFTLTVGTSEFSAGGKILIQFPNNPQLQDPPAACDQPGFIWGSTSNAGILPCDTPDETLTMVASPPRIAEFTVTDKLFEGDKVYMKYRGVMRKAAGTIRWKYKTDADANGLFEPSDGALAFFDDEDFTFEAQAPAYIQLTAPADLEKGELFDLAVVAFDLFANEANDLTPPVLELSSDAFPSGSMTLDMDCLANGTCPTGVLAVSGHPSVAVISGLTYTTPGFHKITATTQAGIPVYTHYTYVHAQTPVYRRFFGDTHFHTGSGSGNSWPVLQLGDERGNYTEAAQAYEYVRQVARLDFAALSEHAESLAPGWDDVQGYTEAYNAEDDFRPLRAFLS